MKSMQKSFTTKAKLWKVMKICAAQITIAILLAGVALAHDNYGQLLDRKVTLSVHEVPLQEALKKIQSVTSVKIFYSVDQLNFDDQVSINASAQSLRSVLNELLLPYNIKYIVHEKNLTIVLKKFRNSPDESSILLTSSLPNHKSSDAFAVTGKVIDGSSSQPLAGVNVVVKGTATGTSTDADGKYSLQAVANDILIFSFIGYQTNEIRVGDQTTIDVTLMADLTALKEVIINAGYWDVKEKEQTGNISKVSSVDIAKQPVSNPLQALQGRVPGVYIQQANGVPGSNITVRIRGQNSISGGNDPLYIIDNVPFIPGTLSSQSTSGNILGANGISPLNSINPSDIESIEVLKDADATAIYGSRGANGVILVTTKKGKSTTGGKPVVGLNIYTGASHVTRRLAMLTTSPYVSMRKEAFKKDNVTPSLSNAADLVAWDTTRYTDWQKELIGGQALTTNIQASLAGGNSNTQFSIRGGYETQGTVFPGDLNADKVSSALSLSHVSDDKRFKGSFSTTYNINTSNLIAQDFTSKSLTLAPDAPAVYNNDGTLNWQNSTWQNPLAQLENKYRSQITNLITNASIGYMIIPNLEASASFGFNDMRLNDKSLISSTSYDPALNFTSANSQNFTNTATSQSWIIEPKLNYSKAIGHGVLSLFTGITFQSRHNESTILSGTGFPSNALIEDLSSATTVLVPDYNNTLYHYAALFGRINYIHNGKYILNLTGRRDGSSRFGPDRRFANFGAVGAAWIFSKESFLSNSSVVSFGKIRSSFGTTGNDQIGDYQFLSTYQSFGAYNGVAGLAPSRLYNPDFAWEVNRKFEVGLELGFFNDRIALTTSYYNNRSSNQLVNYPLSIVSGFTGIQANLDATVQNTGYEFVLNTKNISNALFSWTTSFNLTLPANKLISFPGLQGSTYANRFVVGQPLTIQKKYEYMGIDPLLGVHQVADLNGDNVITTADLLRPENVGVKMFGGLTNSLTYKNFQLDFLFQFVGQTAVGYWGQNSLYPGFMVNQPMQVLDNRWVTEGDADRSVQRFTVGSNSAAVTGFSRYASSDQMIVNASFIRLKNVSLSYDLPAWKSLNSRVYVQGQNLLTFTDYFGLDPENSSATGLPLLRTFVAGLQLNF